jgi:site-specific DNA recombinase
MSDPREQRIEAVLYARVSSEEQKREGFSIPAQLKMLREYADSSSYHVVKEFSDAESASTTGRERFSEMLAYLRKHPRCRLLVEKTDRLYRNAEDYVEVQRLKVEVHCVRNGSIVGPESDPAIQMAHLFELGIARHFSQNLGLEVKK